MLFDLKQTAGGLSSCTYFVYFILNDATGVEWEERDSAQNLTQKLTKNNFKAIAFVEKKNKIWFSRMIMRIL